MTQHQSAFDASQGQPNLEVLQILQEEFPSEVINSLVRVEKVSVTASGTSGVAATTIPVGAEIMDVLVHATATSGSGTAQVTVGGGGAAITDAIICAVLDAKTTASTIDQTYKIVGIAGIEVVTNADADTGDIYISYKK